MERSITLQHIRKAREYLYYLERHIIHVEQAWSWISRRCSDMHFVQDKFIYSALEKEIAAHDMSKLSAEEFTQYRRHFYPVPGEEVDKAEFEKAWEHHKEHNLHHWESWTNAIFLVPYAWEVSCVHMVVDWVAMSLEHGGTALEYYEAHKDRIKFPDHATALINMIFERIYDY